MNPINPEHKKKYLRILLGFSIVLIIIGAWEIALAITKFAPKIPALIQKKTINIESESSAPEKDQSATKNSIFERTPKDISLQRYASCQALNESIKSNNDDYESLNTAREMQGAGLSAPSAESPTNQELAAELKSSDFSGTNVQVKGVDEADIVKTDGKYIYTYSQAKKHISVVDALPPEKMGTISTIPYTNDRVSQMFLDGKKLAVFGTRYPKNQNLNRILIPTSDVIDTNPQELMSETAEKNAGDRRILPPQKPTYPLTAESFMDIWDVSNPSDPKQVRSIGFEGNYVTSRLYNGTVYVALNATARYYPQATDDSSEGLIPRLHDSVVNSGELRSISRCDQIEYFNPIHDNRYFILAAIPTQNDGAINTRTILGYSENVYMSQDNFYIARQEKNSPLVRHITNNNLPDGVSYDTTGSAPDTRNTPSTTINKFALYKGKIYYQGDVSVPGTVLNQFSMDEYNGNLRVATTLGYNANDWRNALYVIDKDLQQIGQIEKLAPGEKIYSARFMGDRAYLVTFRQVDPFFVLDLENPRAPKVLGKLKIPGFSQYLHPFGNDRVIGVGKVADEYGRPGGVKLALFDVSDLTSPKEVDVVEIGGAGTTTEVLTDHKAFLFDAKKQLLVLPITLMENYRPAFQGAYVFRATKDGFEYRSRLAHTIKPSLINNQGYTVRRSLYIGDVIYTISGMKAFAHRLGDLVSLGDTDL